MKFIKSTRLEILLEPKDFIFQSGVNLVFVSDGHLIYESIEKPVMPNMLTPVHVKLVPKSERERVEKYTRNKWQFYERSIF